MFTRRFHDDLCMDCRANVPFQESQQAKAIYSGPSIIQADSTSSSAAAAAPSDAIAAVSRRKILADSISDDTTSSWMVVYIADTTVAYIKSFCAKNITSFGLNCDNVFTTALLGFSCRVGLLTEPMSRKS